MNTVARLLRYWTWWRVGLVAVSAASLAAAVAVSSVALAVVLALVAVAALACLIGLIGARVDSHHSRLAGAAAPTPAAEPPEDPLPVRVLRLGAEVHADDLAGKVVIAPMAAYHLAEVTPLRDALARRGVGSVVMVDEPWLSQVAGGLDHATTVLAMPQPGDWLDRVRALVVFNDWDARLAPLIDHANRQGVPTFAKVEGVQDFEDADVPIDRRPYRRVAHVLCQGANDVDALAGAHTHVVGSSRLERLWSMPPRPRPVPQAVVNVNFTFGVLESARDAFVDSAVEGCRLAGIPVVISAHPHDQAGRSHPLATTVSMAQLLPRASVLITRFSTVAFEAMALGVPVVYHNPHGEQVPTFARPDGAFDISTDAESLAAAVLGSGDWVDRYRPRCEDFFRRQVDIDPQLDPAQRAAAAILGDD